MQCPKCKYEPTLAEIQRSPDDCVSCGINYAGYSRSIAEDQRRKEIAEGEKQALASARRSEKNIEMEKYSAPVKSVMAGYDGAQPVVVVDVHMSFNSMVWFMVKAAIASIPAFIILLLIGAAFFAFFAGFFGALHRP